MIDIKKKYVNHSLLYCYRSYKQVFFDLRNLCWDFLSEQESSNLFQIIIFVFNTCSHNTMFRYVHVVQQL